jgi:hypothetical protein
MLAGSNSGQARTELQLWRPVLASELRGMRFTLGEASCLADVLNSSMLDQTTLGSGVRIVYAECFTAFRLARNTPLPGESSYAAKWKIDEQSLLGRLGELARPPTTPCGTQSPAGGPTTAASRPWRGSPPSVCSSSTPARTPTRTPKSDPPLAAPVADTARTPDAAQGGCC